MKVKSESNGNEVFDRWKSEHQLLEQYTSNLCEWIASQTKLRDLQFQETVKKLAELNEQLQGHFMREGQISEHLQSAHRDCTLDADAVKRQIDKDHANISNRLKHLIDRMQEAEHELDAWKKGVHELGLIIDLIEQHDEQEAESVTCLLPHASL